MNTSKKLRGLQEQKAEKLNAMKTVVNKAEANDRDMTTVEQAKFSKIMAETEALNVEIEAEQKLIDNEATMPGVPLNSGGLVHGNPLAREGVFGRAKDATFAGMFPTAGRSNGGFESFSDFMAPIHMGQFHPGLMASTGMSEGVGADGGFLVPTEYAARMLDKALEGEVVRPRARIEPMASNIKMVAGFDTTDHSASIGGFTAQWIGEGNTMTPQKGQIRQFNLKVAKLAILAAATNELLGDGTSFEQLLEDQLSAALAWNLDDAFLNGDGVGKPLGVFNDPALIVAVKETSQTADTVNQFNLARMVSRLHPACFSNSTWVVHPETIKELMTATLPAMNVARTENIGVSGDPVLQQTDNGLFMLTRPVVVSEKLAQLGDEGDILLADFSQYVIGLRPEITLRKSEHIYFDSDEVGYRALVRADGRGSWKAAMTPKNGSTLSWCVTLAARA